MTSHEIDCAVVGGGVIGLAAARALALAGRKVVLLEAERALGMHTSSRNSEVIHAGLYAPVGSLKAKLCVEGRHALVRYCATRGVSHAQPGKIIVATEDAQREKLEALYAQGVACGVTDLRMLSRDEVRALEPAVSAVAGLLSPSTGIVDSHGFMRALRADAESAGATLVLGAMVRGGAARADGSIELDVEGAEHARVSCRAVVNAAGHGAVPLARALVGVAVTTVPTAYFAAGHYYALRTKSPFARLIYPIAEPGSLGIHVTLDLDGRCRFGPDIRFKDALDYRFDDSRRAAFASAIRRYYPALDEDALEPGIVGVRPKIHGPEERVADFRIDGPDVHGVVGLVNLFGIESPGLTAALAIAERVASLL